MRMTNFHSKATTSRPTYIDCMLVFSVLQYTQNFLARNSEIDLLINEPRAFLHYKYVDKENIQSAKPFFYTKEKEITCLGLLRMVFCRRTSALMMDLWLP